MKAPLNQPKSAASRVVKVPRTILQKFTPIQNKRNGYVGNTDWGALHRNAAAE